jgi:hypothetical protein
VNRCECNEAECVHPHGRCKRDAAWRIEIFGKPKKFCSLCAAIAQAQFGDEIAVIRQLAASSLGMGV